MNLMFLVGIIENLLPKISALSEEKISAITYVISSCLVYVCYHYTLNTFHRTASDCLPLSFFHFNLTCETDFSLRNSYCYSFIILFHQKPYWMSYRYIKSVTNFTLMFMELLLYSKWTALHRQTWIELIVWKQAN